MLALEVDFLDRPPQPNDEAVVGLIDLSNNNSFEPLAITKAWNFQQGSRQQWIPGEQTRVIYNDRNKDQFVSIVLDVSNGKRKELSCPIYAVDPNGTYGLGINFARLKDLGGYGYAGGRDPYQDKAVPEEDGIYLVNLGTGNRELLISIGEVTRFGNGLLRGSAHHYLTHLAFNHDGTRFCFVDRYFLRDGGSHACLYTANLDGTGLFGFPVQVSHFDWASTNEILLWGRNRPRITSLRRKNFFALPFIRHSLKITRKFRSHMRQHVLGDRYMLLTDRSNEIRSLGVGVLTEDGHPSFSPDGQWIVTDTYADKDHYRTLILYNCKENSLIEIGRFYSLPDPSFNVDIHWEDSEMRSDLHPRWNRRGTKINIDSVHEGTRQLYIVDVEEIVKPQIKVSS